MTQNIYGLGDFNTAQIQELVKTLEDEKLDPTIVWYRRPDAAPDPKSIITTMSLDEVPYIIPDALSGEKGVELIKLLSFDALEAIGSDGDSFIKETIALQLQKALTTNPNDVRIKERLDYINASPAWQA
mgnify:CR=1 FL=1